MHALVLTTDAYGGRGGIALYNRDFLEAVASHPRITSVTVVPRTQQDPTGKMPSNLRFMGEAASGARAWLRSSVAEAAMNRPDLVVCGHLNLLPVAHALATARRVPLMLLIYGIEAWTSPRNPATRVGAHMADAVVSISSITLDRFRGWAQPRGRTHILPNAIHLDEYSAGPRPQELARRLGVEGKRVLLTLGRLDARERYKGVDEMLELMPRLLARHDDVVYVVAGDGTDRARLEEKARTLGVASRVVFAGRVSDEDKADIYRLADAFVMPGRGEGFGFVFLEARACGIPCVGSVLDGRREALRYGKLGVLVDPDDAEDLLEGVESALASERGVVPRALAYFDLPRFVQRTHAILDTTLARAATEHA